jgi:hypothetical protein
MWSEREGNHDAHVYRVEGRGDRIVVAISWADRQGARQGWAHALKLEDGMIVDMQDYSSAKRAAAAVQLRAVFG